MDIEIHPYIDSTGLENQLNFSKDIINIGEFQRGGIWFPNSFTILSGTFPPLNEYANRKGYIHYSSSKNQFWKHIDSIYNTSLFINNKTAINPQLRIQNAIEKIDFAKKYNLGFVDVFSKIQRKVNSSKDTDLIEIETIFENGIFEELLDKGVKQFVFVYSLSKEIFLSKIYNYYKQIPKVVRPYNFENIPLEVSILKLKGKDIFLSYSPIHGKITWELKQKALKKTIELELL